jgi:gluconolactonase
MPKQRIYLPSALSSILLVAATLYCHLLQAEDSPRTIGTVERLDPALDQIIPPGAKLEVIGEGYKWCEGPCWIRAGNFLLFSDTPSNTIMRWDAKSGSQTFLTPSGYTGKDPRGGETGSNALTLDRNGRLILCQHGDRRVARLDSSWDKPEAKYETLADKYEGKRLNGPNDAVVDSKGAIYFTDPPYGLEKIMDDPKKELDFQGVYRIAPDGDLALLTKELERPNGIALSPDEKTLYVANSHGPPFSSTAFW